MSMFQAGQLWSYHNRPGEIDSRILVLKVDPDEKLGFVVHVFIDKVVLQCPQVPTGVVDTVSHAPFAEEFLKTSVRDLTATGKPLPPFQEVCANWRQAYDKGEAGAWSVSVAECLESLQKAMLAP